MRTLTNLLRRQQAHLPLLAALFLTTPILFFQALRYSFPLGYAGMFTMIAEDLAAANFVLPMQVPYYGPGGIPLVYPPLAMYLFALALKLGVSTWLYLRLMPAFFTLLAMIPLYYLTVELAGSRLAGALAVVLAVTQPAVYYTHVWSAGVVRGLALFFCLLGLYLYVRCLRSFSWRSLLLSGLALGLLLMTHWLYVMFAALVGFAFLITEWKPARFTTALGILATALLTAAPWLGVIVARHGVQAPLMAYSSHRNADFLFALGETPAAIQFVLDNLNYVLENGSLTALTLAGIVLLLWRRTFHLPLAFVLILLMGEASFYAQILAGMLAGAFGAEILARMQLPGAWQGRRLAGAGWLAGGLLMLGLAAASAGNGLLHISGYEPEINDNSLRATDFVRGQTDPQATYLFVGKINEAEWFPYLFERTPVFGSWGSEWRGQYAEQSAILFALQECSEQKDWDCIEGVLETHAAAPDLLVTRGNRWLIQPVRQSGNWDRIYTDDLYLVWQRVE